jgi:hypothetical protein
LTTEKVSLDVTLSLSENPFWEPCTFREKKSTFDVGFSEAHLCTPTIIVLPTEIPEELSVCRLQTTRLSLGLGGIIKITSANSRWTCQIMKINVRDPRDQLTVQEQQCLPDILGNIKSNCEFPFIARSQFRIRTRND